MDRTLAESFLFTIRQVIWPGRGYRDSARLLGESTKKLRSHSELHGNREIVAEEEMGKWAPRTWWQRAQCCAVLKPNTNAQRMSLLSHLLRSPWHFFCTKFDRQKPPTREGFQFTMLPHQEPCVRGPPSKDLYQVLGGGSSYTRFLMREHSK